MLLQYWCCHNWSCTFTQYDHYCVYNVGGNGQGDTDKTKDPPLDDDCACCSNPSAAVDGNQASGINDIVCTHFMLRTLQEFQTFG